MGLKNLRLPSAEINVPGGESFTVRGLSTVELEDLYRNNKESVSELFDKYMSGDDEPNWNMLISDTLRLAPGLIAEVIAIGADAPEDVDVVQKFPPGLQMKALERIGALTFSLDTEGKNLLEIVAAFLENLTPLLEVGSRKLAELEVLKNAQQSTDGSGTYAGT